MIYVISLYMFVVSYKLERKQNDYDVCYHQEGGAFGSSLSAKKCLINCKACLGLVDGT